MAARTRRNRVVVSVNFLSFGRRDFWKVAAPFSFVSSPQERRESNVACYITYGVTYCSKIMQKVIYFIQKIDRFGDVVCRKKCV